MSEPEQISTDDLTPTRINGKFAKGCSGNPAGRKPLVPSEALRKDLSNHASELLDKAIFEALNGDNNVLIFLLNRLISPYRPTSQPLNLEISNTSPLALANSLIVEAISGNNAPDSALAALGALNTLVNVKAQSDLQQRIEALEQRLLTVNV